MAVDKKFHSHMLVEDDILLRSHDWQIARSKIKDEVPVQFVMKPGVL